MQDAHKSDKLNLVPRYPEAAKRPAGAPLALSGVRVIDFTHFIAGPLATMILADMGAEVIKVEAPGRGDEFRYYPPVRDETPDRGVPYKWSNRNKLSLALDLKSDEGRQIALDLIASADVLAENFSTGVMERLGLGYEQCRAVNPRLIYCTVSAYGRVGEFADRLGFDPVAQAESGFMSMNGYPDRDGVRTLSPVIDISTAMMASNAMLGALVARDRTNEGQQVEVALFDNAMLMIGYASLQTIYTEQDTRRHGNTSPDTSPSGVFHCANGSFYINCGNDKIFRRLASQVLERPDLLEDPELSDRNGRMNARGRLFPILDEIFITQPWAYWQERMRAASVPCGEVRSVAEAMASPEAVSRSIIERVEDQELGWVPNVRSPIRMSGTPLVDPVAASSVGAQTDSVLKSALGKTTEEIEALRERRVIQ
jgi:crotonobetainyl-CoA:carnitine CoA-transferase CaiB-like acyl-CoA transferase